MLQLDHIVHVVPDLPEAAAALRHVGLHVVPGGEHPGWGTHNALSYFDLTYLELIAVRDSQVAVGSGFGAGVMRSLQAGEGPATVAFRSRDIAADVAALRARDVAIGDPQGGSRTLPDGTVIGWRLALPPWPQPFLIQWEQPDLVRRASLQGRGALGGHPLGPNLAFRQVAWAVCDLRAGAAWVEAYGGTPGAAFADSQLGAVCVGTDMGILLCAPAGPGLVREWLDRRGEGPFLYDLTGPEGPEALVGPERACGAWIRVSNRRLPGA